VKSLSFFVVEIASRFLVNHQSRRTCLRYFVLIDSYSLDYMLSLCSNAMARWRTLLKLGRSRNSSLETALSCRMPFADLNSGKEETAPKSVRDMPVAERKPDDEGPRRAR